MSLKALASWTLVVLLACVGAVRLSSRTPPSRPAVSKPRLESDVRRPSKRELGLTRDRQRDVEALKRLRPRVPSSWSHAIHALRLWGPRHFQDKAFWSPAEALEAILDSERYQSRFDGDSLHVATRHGIAIKFLPQRSDQSNNSSRRGDPHRDKTLSVLALLEVPVNQPLVVEGNLYSVADLIHESVATFSLDQEIEWSFLVYALYLSEPRCENKFGEHFQMDDLLEALLKPSSPMVDHSCFGTHHVFSVAFVLRCDQERHHTLVKPEFRRRSEEWLAKVVQRLESTQEFNGAWNSQWCGQSPASGSSRAGPELVVTSHLVEALAYLPDSVILEKRMVERALDFLTAQILSQSDATIDRLYPAYSHAGNALLSFCPSLHAEVE